MDVNKMSERELRNEVRLLRGTPLVGEPILVASGDMRRLNLQPGHHFDVDWSANTVMIVADE